VSIITSAQHLSALVTLGISGVSYPYRSLPTTSSPFYPSDMASSRSRCLLGVLRSCVVKRWKLTTVMDKVRSEHLLQLTILQSSHLAERPERTTGYFETAPMLVVERHGSRSVLLEITSLTVCAYPERVGCTRAETSLRSKTVTSWSYSHPMLRQERCVCCQDARISKVLQSSHCAGTSSQTQTHTGAPILYANPSDVQRIYMRLCQSSYMIFCDSLA
jgi:hypothetical protein